MISLRNLAQITGVMLLSGFAAASYAQTTCGGANQGCSVTIATDPGAAISNFGTPGSTATEGYMISTSDDGTNFYVNVSDTNAGASSDPEFSNLYFDTIASTPGSGSNLGFEFSANSANSDAFDPGPSTKYSLVGTGVTSVFTQDATGTDAMITIPNSFFLNNPLGMAFTPTMPGDLVSLHLSQSYGYSVVGGSGNYAAPVELGDAVVGSATVTPEPSSFVLLGTGMLFVGFAGKKLWA